MVESMDDALVISADEVVKLGLDDWRTLQSKLHARFRTGNFATGLAFVNAIAAVAEEMNHHPDIDFRYTHVQIALISHDVGGLTARDVRLAERISEIAAGVGATTEPHLLTLLEAGLDTWDADAIMPFWRAVLATPDNDRGEVIDPLGFVPTIWFQGTDEHPSPRQRWHFDVWVALDEAASRIAAACAAGGVVVDDTEAPTFTVLADPQGNRVCICTHYER